MRRLIAFALTLAVAAGSASSVEALGGCGPGWHPGPYGRHCFRNGPAVIVNPRVGVFVTGRGYWDGRRYWWHRGRWHDGWRYW